MELKKIGEFGNVFAHRLFSKYPELKNSCELKDMLLWSVLTVNIDDQRVGESLKISFISELNEIIIGHGFNDNKRFSLTDNTLTFIEDALKYIEHVYPKSVATQ